MKQAIQDTPFEGINARLAASYGLVWQRIRMILVAKHCFWLRRTYDFS